MKLGEAMEITTKANAAASDLRGSALNLLPLLAATLIGSALSGCGGGVSESSTNPTQSTGPTQYDFQTPTAGAVSDFSDQIVDNSENTINLTATFRIDSVNSDGSFVDQFQAGGSGITVNGTLYGGADETEMYNASGGLLFATELENSGSSVTCNYSPASGLPYPLYVGETWTQNWTESCSDGHTYITALTGGIVDDVESITVTAGTFNALKLQYQLVISDGQNSIVETDTVTEWRDTETNHLVEEQIAYSYNAPPNGTNSYAVSKSRELMSYTP